MEAQSRSVLFERAGSDADGAFTNAYLFICSPHSCEVVKPFFTFFWKREPNLKMAAIAALADRCIQGEALTDQKGSIGFERFCTIHRAHRRAMTCVGGSLWAERRR